MRRIASEAEHIAGQEAARPLLDYCDASMLGAGLPTHEGQGEFALACDALDTLINALAVRIGDGVDAGHWVNSLGFAIGSMLGQQTEATRARLGAAFAHGMTRGGNEAAEMFAPKGRA